MVYKKYMHCTWKCEHSIKPIYMIILTAIWTTELEWSYGGLRMESHTANVKNQKLRITLRTQGTSNWAQRKQFRGGEMKLWLFSTYLRTKRGMVVVLCIFINKWFFFSFFNDFVFCCSFYIFVCDSYGADMIILVHVSLINQIDITESWHKFGYSELFT